MNMRTALVRMIPYISPHRMFGSVTFQNTYRSDAPSVRAASSWLISIASRIGMSSLATNGIVTKSVARAMPASQYAASSLC